jgi:hypothetical protein
MDKLIALKTVIERVYVAINNDGRTDIIVPMASMAHKPLVTFATAYEAFIKSVAVSSALFDRWLNIQMQVYTELRDDQDAITQFAELFQNVLNGTEGGAAGMIPAERFQDTSFIIALAFRVYLDAIVIEGVKTPREQPAEEGAAA